LGIEEDGAGCGAEAARKVAHTRSTIVIRFSDAFLNVLPKMVVLYPRKWVEIGELFRDADAAPDDTRPAFVSRSTGRVLAHSGGW
jgi:hypothetical protein